MKLEQRAIADALGTILMHNVADAEGDRVLKKGARLTGDHLVLLAELGREVVDVAVWRPTMSMRTRRPWPWPRFCAQSS
ncbi:MAG: hypothetical protein ACUVWZ_15405 [Anaerolineae bacterium]